MSEMQNNETIERFSESMKRAASRAREMGRAQKNKDWDNVAQMIEGIRTKGEILIKSKQIGRQEALGILKIREDKMKVN